MNTEALSYTDASNRAAHGPFKPVTVIAPDVYKPDDLLIARLREGDERTFNDLVNKNHGALIRMALRYVSDRDLAEEVAQDTWIAVIDGVKDFEGRSSLNTWIFSILIHKAKDRGVRESRHINFSMLESTDEDSGDEAVDPSRFQASGELAGHWALPPQPWDEHTPERLLASKQAFGALNQALERLPPRLRQVIMLKDVEGLASDEICAQLQITETNLYVRLHRARERVRQAVEAALASQPRDVSSGGFATLMGTAHAITRKPCPSNAKPQNSLAER